MATVQATLNESYIGERRDIQKLIPRSASTVLDIGCSNGALGAAIKKSLGVTVHGIEYDEHMGVMAAVALDEVYVGDASAVVQDGSLGNNSYDVIICADILEHLVDPWATLEHASSHLAPGGVIITSLPNIRHISTIADLVVRGRWAHNDRGIHDRTHLRFFTRRSVEELFTSSGLSVDEMRVNYRFFDKPTKINALARLFALPGVREFLAYQYLVVASKQPQMHC